VNSRAMVFGVTDPIGELLSCKNRGYFDLNVHFSTRDLLMLFECIVANRVAVYYLRYLQPLIGMSNDPVPVPHEYINNYIMPVYSFCFFTLLYFGCAGGFTYFYYMPYGNDYVLKNKVQKEKPFVWSEETRKKAGATDHDLKMFWKSISTSMKAVFAAAWVACYQVAILRGETNIYWTFSRKGPCETMFWFVVAYLTMDMSGYWIHRALHWPWMYKHIHKMHHIWKSPSPWVVIALVPAEFLMLTVASMTIFSIIPLWFPLYLFLILFTFFYNTMDHSGIEIPSIWFWQAPVNFHDRHHEHFHVNYAPMVDWWDKLLGSYYYEGVTKGGEDKFHDHWEHSPKIVRRLSKRLSRVFSS